MTTLTNTLERITTPEILAPQPPIPRVLTGSMFDARCRRLNPTEAALLAADLVAGRAILERPTADQALRLTGATWRYYWVARSLTPLERASVEFGRVTLSSLAQGRCKASIVDLVA